MIKGLATLRAAQRTSSMSQASSSPIDPERRDDIQAVPSPGIFFKPLLDCAFVYVINLAALRAAQRTSSMSQTSHSPTFPTPPEKGSVVPLPNIEGNCFLAVA